MPKPTKPLVPSRDSTLLLQDILERSVTALKANALPPFVLNSFKLDLFVSPEDFALIAAANPDLAHVDDGTEEGNWLSITLGGNQYELVVFPLAEPGEPTPAQLDHNSDDG